MQKKYLLLVIILAIVHVIPTTFAMKKLTIQTGKDALKINKGKELVNALNGFLSSGTQALKLSLCKTNLDIFIRACMDHPLTPEQTELFSKILYGWASSNKYDYSQITFILSIFPKYDYSKMTSFGNTLPKNEHTFINALIDTVDTELYYAIKQKNYEKVAYALSASGNINRVMKALVNDNEIDAIRNALLMNITFKRSALIKYLLKSTKDTRTLDYEEKRHELFYLLLEQLPVNLFPTFTTTPPNYFNFDLNEYIKLQQIDSLQSFQKWLYCSDEERDLKIMPLFLYGNKWQLNETVNLRLDNLLASGLKIGRNEVLVACCIEALSSNSFSNFLLLLSLCAQQQMAQTWMFKEKFPKNKFLADRSLQFSLFNEFKKYPWANQIPHFKTAFAPLKTQNKLIKILKKNVKKYKKENQKKMLTELEDVKLAFNQDWQKTRVKIEEQN